MLNAPYLIVFAHVFIQVEISQIFVASQYKSTFELLARVPMLGLKIYH